jgi:cellulose synthase/poly-beta-1,6-N-acetylglucosamine synthase-like glycosyltransferase
MLYAWTVASAACAAIPALLTVANLAEYKPPPPADASLPLPSLSVLIPARNEEAGIAACVESVLASRGVQLEVLVMDDGSTDGTAAIVGAIAIRDARVKLLRAAALPAGWNGKQHACWQAAQAAASPVFCFLDADVRLQPDALARVVTLLVRERAALVSGFPREITGTVMEKLLIPLIHFVLLGLLPMRWLRMTTRPGFAAGCGQLLLVDRAAYFASGGHEAIRTTMHDGLLLPRLLRQHGYSTRLADLTDLAQCRMYRSAAETWNGLAKNATEGLAAPARIVPITLLLGLGQVLPAVLLWLAWQRTFFVIPFLGPPLRVGMQPVGWAAAALVLSYMPRLINTVRYRQSWLGALLHPLGVALLLVLQWVALARKLTGRPATWKARSYPAG